MRIDSVLYVNLPESSFRRTSVEKEIRCAGLSRIARWHAGVRVARDAPLPKGFRLEVLGACYGPNEARNALGCALAHWNAYELIKANGWGHTLILEDDAVFDHVHFTKLISNAPDDADILYLNRSQWPVQVIEDPNNNHLFERVFGQLCTVGYVVRQSIIDRLIERCNPYTEYPSDERQSIIDVVLSQQMSDMKIYRPMKEAIKQDLEKFGSTITGIDGAQYRKFREQGLSP